MNTSFTIKEILTLAWKKTKEHIAFLVLITLGFVIGTLLLDFLGKGTILSLVHIVFNCFAMFTFVRMGLRFIKGENFTFNDVIAVDWKSFGLYILGSLLFFIAYVVGFFLLIIPGIIAAIRLGFFGFIMLDEHLQPIPALKKSFEMTRNHFWKLLGFAFVVGLINFAGALLAGVGMLVTAPFSLLATSYMYDRIKSLPRTETPVSTQAQ